MKAENSSFNNENYKYTCKLEIEIDNCNEFQVSRRIIGPKGRNMKKIIETCKENDELNDSVKLRLRGRGSGYREGTQNVESDEVLHLCVSSKSFEKFNIACAEAEKLLLAVYIDYGVFLKKKGIPPTCFSIKKMSNLV